MAPAASDLARRSTVADDVARVPAANAGEGLWALCRMAALPRGRYEMMQDQQLRQARIGRMQKSLRRDVGRAIREYNMIEPGDRVMVCVSGGKDSLTLLDVLLSLQRHAPVEFTITAVNLDQRQPGFPEDTLPSWFSSIGVDHAILREDTYSLVRQMVPEGKTYCGWCSRFRRGILYRFAAEQGYHKIALGHHREDVVETLFLNLFHGGKLKAMPPKLVSDDGRNVVIRPLYYCAEKDLARYARVMEFPIIPCDLCGSQDHLQRRAIKAMIAQWEKEQPGRTRSILRAITDVVPSHLADPSLHDFRALVSTGPAAGRIDVANL
jgi:tRNA 2-thiocytidine biosynthesis protein TtcA